MYKIVCDGNVLYDPRDEELIVLNPKCNLEVNTIGEASFSIFADHPYYGELKKLRSVFEILQDNEPIFRGRMVDDAKDFENTKDIDLEGVLGFFNDSVVRPFSFPDDFLSDADYVTAAASGNVVEFFLSWLITKHNAQVQAFQQFKLGKVTVTDKNNYITRSNSSYASTWETLKTKLFGSSLGGYLCIRYEEDGNYIDYLKDFEETNSQRIEYGENLLDLSSESDASATYSAIIPLGAQDDDETTLTIESLADGNVTDDIVKSGDTLYSKSAVEAYGWIYAPTSETTWDDVTLAENLQSSGVEYLTETATLLANTIKITAVDLHFSDDEIEAFRIYKYVDIYSAPHGQEDSIKLTRLEIDLLNPQNTVITLGETTLSLTDINSANKSEYKNDVGSISGQMSSSNKETSERITSLETACRSLSEADTALQNKITALSEAVIDLIEADTAIEKQLAAVKDTISEVGASGVWTYRKWTSGIAECWGIVASESITDPMTYPVTFKGDPCVQTTENGSNVHYYVIGKV